MTVLINIISPLVILGLLLFCQEKFNYSVMKKMIGMIGAIFGLLTIPLIAFDYHFYNWIFEYFKTPAFLISISLILTLFISKKYFKWSIISFLSLAFVLNLGYQFILHFAQMGGDWIPNNCPDFRPPILTYKNYNIIKGGGYFIHETKANGLVYKELSHKWELSQDCKTVFNLNNSGQTFIFDSCKNELIINK